LIHLQAWAASGDKGKTVRAPLTVMCTTRKNQINVLKAYK